jgi:hypothetical protein
VAIPDAQLTKLIDLLELMTMASLLLFHIIAGGGGMSTVALPYHVAFAVLCVSTLSAIYSANAKQADRPLAVTTTVTNSCSLAVVRTVPEKSVDLMNASKLVRARCREGTVWRIEVEKSTSEAVMEKMNHTSAGSGTRIRVTINF